MRYDSQAARLLARKPAADRASRRLALTGIGAAVALISVVSLLDQVAPQVPAAAGGCVQNWPYLDAGCGADASPASGDAAIRPIRVIGLDRNAPAIVAKAVERPAAVLAVAVPVAVRPATIPLAAAGTAKTGPAGPAKTELAKTELAKTELVKIEPATPAPSTDGSGQFAAPTTHHAVTAPPPLPPIQFSEQDLTFKAGAVHRRAAGSASTKTAGNAAAAEARHEAAPKPRKLVRAPKRQEHKQVYELPDGRRVTVFRRYAGEQAAGNGGSFSEPFAGAFGGRRALPGVSGLY